MERYDILIIGGGVVGSAVARELARYKLRIGVVEKELDVCCATSGRNTGMLHAGFTYKPGSLKATCAVEGNAEFDHVAHELDIPFRRTGKLIIGFDDDDKARLLRFKEVGKQNGVPGLEIIDRKRMDEIDESAGGNFAMYAPTSGILNPFIFNVALAENAHANGVEFFFGRQVIDIVAETGGYRLITPEGDFHTRWVVNAAGLNCAVISSLLGIKGYVIGGFKGEYIVLDKKAGAFAKIPVYPAPNANGGFATHATPTIDGNVLVGPNSYLTDDFEDYDVTASSLDELIREGQKMFAHVKYEYFIRSFAGIRPKLLDPETRQVKDFVIESRDEVPQVINLVGIESPGLTCALPIARRAVALLAQKETLELKTDFNPVRRGPVCFAEQNTEGRKRLIKENADYGEIVCRCECVTRAEILQAIHNPLGAHTLNGIKNRTRAMMGRCQGGYCETRISEMLQSELNLSEKDIFLGKPNSSIFTGRMRP